MEEILIRYDIHDLETGKELIKKIKEQLEVLFIKDICFVISNQIKMDFDSEDNVIRSVEDEFPKNNKEAIVILDANWIKDKIYKKIRMASDEYKYIFYFVKNKENEESKSECAEYIKNKSDFKSVKDIAKLKPSESYLYYSKWKNQINPFLLKVINKKNLFFTNKNNIRVDKNERELNRFKGMIWEEYLYSFSNNKNFYNDKEISDVNLNNLINEMIKEKIDNNFINILKNKYFESMENTNNKFDSYNIYSKFNVKKEKNTLLDINEYLKTIKNDDENLGTFQAKLNSGHYINDSQVDFYNEKNQILTEVKYSNDFSEHHILQMIIYVYSFKEVRKIKIKKCRLINVKDHYHKNEFKVEEIDFKIFKKIIKTIYKNRIIFK